MMLENIPWRKPSACGDAGSCVEVAFAGGKALVRDSKLGRFSPVAKFNHGEWLVMLANPALLWLALAVQGLRFTQAEMVAFEYAAVDGEYTFTPTAVAA